MVVQLPLAPAVDRHLGHLVNLRAVAANVEGTRDRVGLLDEVAAVKAMRGHRGLEC